MFGLVVTKEGLVYVNEGIKVKFQSRMNELNMNYKDVGEIIGMDQRNVANYLRVEGKYKRNLTLPMAMRIGVALKLEMFLEIDILE